MADITDIKTVVASALEEISVTGTLDVTMDGAEVVEALGCKTGDDMEVVVIVKPAHQAVVPVKDAA